MTWAKLDDNFPEHPKLRSVGPFGLALQTAAICYCARHLTDGNMSAAVTESIIRSVFSDLTLPNGQVWAPGLTSGHAGRDAEEMDWPEIMVAAGLWDLLPSGDGYLVHDYLDYNPSRAEALKERRDRRAAGRKGGQARSANWRTMREALEARQEAPAKAHAKALAKTPAKADAKAFAKALLKPRPVSTKVSDRRPVGSSSTLTAPEPNTNAVALATESGAAETSADQTSTPAAPEALLVAEILAVTHDPRSAAFYRQVADALPAERVQALLAETRAAVAEGRIRKSPARMFTALARKALTARNGHPDARAP